MKFMVTWLPPALDALAEFWNNGPDQAEITLSADAIDQILSNDPQTKGEERENGVRILVFPPLAIYFIVSEDDRLATVHAVWRWN